MHMNCRLVRCPDQRRYQIVFSKCLCFGDIRKREMGARYINWMIILVSESDPQKGESGKWAGVEVYTVPGMRCTSSWLLISILMCVYWNANGTRASSHFASFHQAGEIRMFLQVYGLTESSTGYGRFSNY